MHTSLRFRSLVCGVFAVGALFAYGCGDSVTAPLGEEPDGQKGWLRTSLRVFGDGAVFHFDVQPWSVPGRKVATAVLSGECLAMDDNTVMNDDGYVDGEFCLEWGAEP